MNGRIKVLDSYELKETEDNVFVVDGNAHLCRLEVFRSESENVYTAAIWRFDAGVWRALLEPHSVVRERNQTEALAAATDLAAARLLDFVSQKG